MSDSHTSKKCYPPERRVRSFVKRQGRMTPGQKRALTEHWPDYGIAYVHDTVDLAAAFGREAPVVLEIGIGNGANIVSMAAADPGSNYIGIEVHEPGIGHCLLDAHTRGMTNLRLMNHDALEVLRDMIPDASLARVNLFFPDPWPKKRHHKRRIVQNKFMQLIARKLLPGGIFHVVTDWENYAVHIAEIMGNRPEFEPLAEVPADRSVSRFDARGQRLGHTNWEQAWCRRSKIDLRE